MAAYHNPINRKEIAKWAVICGLVVLLAFATVFFTGGLIDWTVILFSIAVFIGLFYAQRGHHELAHNPRIAEITESGVLLTKRLLNRVVVVPWNEISSLSVFLGAQDDVRRKPHLGNAILYLKNGKFYELDRHIALEIRDAYQQHVGHYPLPGT
jgi:uncharacterized membrane protein